MNKEIIVNTGFFRSFDNTELYYETHGVGEPIIFIYGLCCQMNHFHHQISYFAKTYKVITFDIRAHHKSKAPDSLSALKISDVAEDAAALMAHLQLTNVRFVGHSFGVPILIELSKNHSDKINSFVFINGFAKNPIKGMFGLDVVEQIYSFIKNQYESSPELLDQLWKHAVNNPLAIWISAIAGGFNFKVTQFKDMEIYVKGVSQVSLKYFLPMFKDLMLFNGERALRALAVPTLIIGGEKDAITPLKMQEEMHSLIKNSQLVTVPYGSHCTQLDFPEYVNLKIEQFFKFHPLDWPLSSSAQK